MGDTKIAWATKGWSPVVGCSKVSAGCVNCYAVRSVWRLAHNPHPHIAADHAGLVRRIDPVENPTLTWTTNINSLNHRIAQPTFWKKPQRVFVCPMGDLFHEKVDQWVLQRVFETMVAAPQHRYLILTKRPERMREWMRTWLGLWTIPEARVLSDYISHVWLGVSVENQKTTNERIPILFDTPAEHRWVSVEPILGPVYLDQWLYGRTWIREGDVFTIADDRRLEWVVAGCESGKGARRENPDWLMSLRNQCGSARTPLFVKQSHDYRGKLIHMPFVDGLIWAQYPPELVL